VTGAAKVDTKPKETAEAVGVLLTVGIGRKNLSAKKPVFLAWGEFFLLTGVF
jgi:hypothetical protein